MELSATRMKGHKSLQVIDNTIDTVDHMFDINVISFW